MDAPVSLLTDGLLGMIRTWKEWKARPARVPNPDFIKEKLLKYEPGLRGMAVQTAVDRGIISDDEAEELL